MPVWIEILVAANVVVTAIVLFLIVRSKSNSAFDPEGQRLLVLQVHETALSAVAKIDQLSAKHEQFAASSASSATSLRSELITTLSTESSNLRLEVLNSITQIGGQTRGTLEELRSSSNERLDRLTSDLTAQQSALRESLTGAFATYQSEAGTKFNEFQAAQTTQGGAIRESIDTTMSRLSREIRESVAGLKADVTNRITEMVTQLGTLKDSAESQQTILRLAVEQRLDKLNESNSKKLDEMRETVDEKLHKTLESRLTESFGIVTEHLGKVQSGLGEMKELATGVGDLKRLLTNVRTRGSAGEFAVGMLLEQMLAPNQFQRNVRVKPETRESVEFAVRIPSGDDTESLLPIDSKFPREDWERLEEALERDDKDAAKGFRSKLLAAIRREARKVSELYINPPTTTNFAILCLATEGLYAEACREPGFSEEIQSQFKVLIAGPTTLMAILSSLQMGFKTLAIQKKGSEVWNLLAATKTEFGKFGALMDKVEKQVGTVQNTLQEVGKRTRVINKTLKSVDVLEMGAPTASPLLDFAAESEEPEEL